MSSVNTEVSPTPEVSQRTGDLDTAGLSGVVTEPEPLESAEAPETAPVFVDVTGRRQRLLKPLGLSVALLCCTYVAAVTVSLLAGSDTPLTPWTGIAPAQDRHAAHSRVSPQGYQASRRAAVRTYSTPALGPSPSSRSSASSKVSSPSAAGPITPATAPTTPATGSTPTTTASASPIATTTHGKSTGKGKAHTK